MIRQTIYFSGRVQGVYFRATTCDIAGSYDVAGFVRNLPDGRVELVAEGEAAELDAFVAAIRTAKRGFIDDVAVEAGSATGEFSGFAVTM